MMQRLLFFALLSAAGCAGGAVARQSGSQIAIDSSRPTVGATVVRPSEPPRDTVRPLSTLDKGWNRIPGREGTGCASDTSFAFRVRPALPDKVLIFLNGGGACWKAQDCDPKGRPTYTTNVDSANDQSIRQGIFDLSNDENPVRDFTMVFVPYCTGDLHLGTRTVDYQIRDAKASAVKREFAVRHQGAENIDAVLDWVYSNVRTPQIVFITGSGTGALATPVIAEQVARHYPRARVVQLGDASGGIRSDSVPQVLASWGATDYLRKDPAFRTVDSSGFSAQRLYLAAGRSAPRVRYSQYNAAEDATQIALLAQFGVKTTTLSRLLGRNVAQLKDGMPWFRSYTAPGRTGAILHSNALYSTKVGGVKFSEWMTSLIEGGPVQDVGAVLIAVPKATTTPAKAKSTPAKTPTRTTPAKRTPTKAPSKTTKPSVRP